MRHPHLIEPIAARGWPAAEAANLGGWRLYASAGLSGRINTCWALGPPERDVDEAIAAAEAWYRARRLAPRFKLVDGHAGPPDLAERLAALGYAPNTPTLTMVGALTGEADPDVAIEPQPGAAFTRVFADETFGDAADARERLDALGRIPAPRGYALLTQDGAPAAIGTCAVERDWAGLIGMRTAPAFRRRGLARRIFRALGDFARAQGASQGYLQVDESNASAIALYRSEGFETAYRYCYWARP